MAILNLKKFSIEQDEGHPAEHEFSLWIFRRDDQGDGEGMEVNPESFEKLIEKFYEEHF